MNLEDTLSIVSDVPNYKVFRTVDELKRTSRQLASKYPNIVENLLVGHSRRGDSIETLKIGNGGKRALLFALPHPNEPIGSMTLEYLSRRLAEDHSLCQSLDYTWYLIKCIDPDSTRLNEGWFKGPFSIEHYALHHYRPPSFQQIEWTFPIDYKRLHFRNPLPETQALMALIRQIRPDFIFSLHNSGFGGAYFYITEESPSLYGLFHKLVASQELPLHLGEPEAPYIPKYANAIFKMTGVTDGYDYLEQHSNTDPAEIIKGGACSLEYAQRYCNPFGLVCEVPYFYHPAIGGTSASDMVRRDAILKGIEQDRDDFRFLQEQYNKVKNALTIPSPFRDSVGEFLRTFEHELAADEDWARTDPKTAETATVAEKFDSMVVRRFYQLFPLGMFIRLLETQIEASGKSPLLTSVHETISKAFEARAGEFETEIDYTVIPIQKLVRIQLGSALLAIDYVSRR